MRCTASRRRARHHQLQKRTRSSLSADPDCRSSFSADPASVYMDPTGERGRIHAYFQKEEVEVARAEEENQADRWVKKQLVSRFRKVLYDRYGGDLMAKIILATGGLSSEALAIVNDISYEKYLERGAVHDVPKKDERQKAGPRQRVLNEAQVARIRSTEAGTTSRLPVMRGERPL